MASRPVKSSPDGADRPRVVERLDAGGDAEHAEGQRECAAPAAAQARIHPAGEAQQRERDEPADEVVAGRRAGLRLEVVVVEDVERDQRDRDPEGDRSRDPAPPRRVSGGAVAGADRVMVAVMVVSATRTAGRRAR